MKRLALLALLPALISAGTPAGLVIENVATYQDDSGTVQSNVVRVTVQEVCAATLSPGDVRRTVRPLDSVTVPFVLTNTGNAGFDFPLGTRLEGNSSVGLSLVADTNLNALADDAPVSSVYLEPDQSVTLLLTGTASQPGVSTITLTTGCGANLTGNLQLITQMGSPAITKTLEGQPTVQAGAQATYSILVSNPERVRMDGVNIRDTLATGLEFVSVTAADGTPAQNVMTTAGADGSTEVAWNTALEASETRTFKLTVRVKPSVPDDTLIQNVATATGAGGSQTSGPATLRVFSAQLLVSKSVSPPVVEAGGLVNYTVTAFNPSGSSVYAVTLSDTPDPRLSVDLGSVKLNGKAAQASFENGVLIVLAGTLSSKTNATLTYAARVPLTTDGTPMNNTVQATGTGLPGPVVATVRSNVSKASVIARPKLGNAGNDVVGRVYVDRNGNGRFDAQTDTPVARARILLAGGREALSDASGLYSFANVPAGVQALRLDPNSVPYRHSDAVATTSRPATTGPSQPKQPDPYAPNGSAVILVSALSVQDFPLQPNGVQSSLSAARAQVTLTRLAGQVRVQVRNSSASPVCLQLAGVPQPWNLQAGESRDEWLNDPAVPGGPQVNVKEVTCP